MIIYIIIYNNKTLVHIVVSPEFLYHLDSEDSIWVNLITTEPCSPEPWESLINFREIIPEIMAQQFRLVNYCNSNGSYM